MRECRSASSRLRAPFTRVVSLGVVLGVLLPFAAACGVNDDVAGVGPRSCVSRTDCAAGELCVDGQCRGGAGDASVADGASCAPEETACGAQCCAAGLACRGGACVESSECGDGNDCPSDAFCAADGRCTPWGEGGFDDTCQRSPERPERFLSAVQCSFTAAPAGDPAPDHIEAHATPVVADFDFDDDPDTVRPSIVWAGDLPGGGIVVGRPVIRIIDGETCAQQHVIAGADQRVGAGPVAVGDLDGDGRPEVVAEHRDGGVIAFRYDPTSGQMVTAWRSAVAAPVPSWVGPSLADLDDDGTPEIVVGGVVYDAAGNLLANNLGQVAVTSFASVLGVVADVDLDGAPELVTHAGVYRWAAGAPANWVLEDYFVGTPGTAGWVAVADFGDFPGAAGDAPGRPEIVVAGLGQVRVMSVGGETLAGPFALGDSAVQRGGPPTVADFDGDGEPEFAAADGSGYVVFELEGEKWSVASQDVSSGVTGSSVFDFEGDGRAEVVYGDECYVRIYDGASGEVLYSVSRTSCTWIENPVVADVDGDFHSEIVVPLDNSCDVGCPAVDPVFDGLRCAESRHCPAGSRCTDGRCACTADSECGDRHGCVDGVCKATALPRRAGVEVLRDSLDRWAGSRPIWNQHAYAVTNVDDRGVVPRSSERRRNWQTAGLNNFRQNVQASFDPLDTPDLTVGRGEWEITCTRDEPNLPLSAEVCNRGAAGVGPGVRVLFRASGEPDAAIACEAMTTMPLTPGRCERVGCTWANPPLDTRLDPVVEVDPEGGEPECWDGNNTTTIEGAICPPPVE